MTTWAIVPVKQLHHAKSRLAPTLSAEERAALMRCLLRRLLMVLGDVKQVDEIVVVSRDQEVSRIAAGQHTHVVCEDEGVGLNGAVQLGQAYAVERGASAILILPTDLPFVTPGDVAALWGETAVSPHNAVICSDRHQEGTNALLLPAATPFRFQYGAQSYQKHVSEAEHRQLKVQTAVIPGLQFDLDTLGDWKVYRERMLVCDYDETCASRQTTPSGPTTALC